MALVTLSNIGLRAGGKWVLWDLDLEVNAGEIVGVLGRTGSGKSTLARILAGLEQPTNGSVSIGDADDQAPSQVSVAFSRPACARDLTVYENLDMFASLWRVPRKRRSKDIAFLLELVKLDDCRNSRASVLSEGALKRLEIARSLLPDSPVVVIDSLLDTLDAEIFEKLWDHVLTLRRNHLKSFVVLTSSGKVAEMCQRIAVLHRGRIGFVGKPEDFRRLAGEDVVVLGDVGSSLVKSRIEQQISVVIKEEDGFLSFRVGNGERMVSELLAEFGTELNCVYLKRPTLEDALNVLGTGGVTASVDVTEGKST